MFFRPNLKKPTGVLPVVRGPELRPRDPLAQAPGTGTEAGIPGVGVGPVGGEAPAAISPGLLKPQLRIRS